MYGRFANRPYFIPCIIHNRGNSNDSLRFMQACPAESANSIA
jgi:hypothetical protein